MSVLKQQKRRIELIVYKDDHAYPAYVGAKEVVELHGTAVHSRSPLSQSLVRTEMHTTDANSITQLPAWFLMVLHGAMISKHKLLSLIHI